MYIMRWWILCVIVVIEGGCLINRPPYGIGGVVIIMNNIKDITNKYPVTNSDWAYRCMPPNMSSFRLDLNSYLNDVLFGIKNVTLYKSEEYIGINEFFVRQSTSDDFYENPAVFTHTGHDIFTYKGNSDPWGRMFVVYKNGINTERYNCKAILSDGGKPMVYVLSTSVEGKIVYCVDRINI